ncbi:DUF3137 domain-containing protein [Henriciella litoralis]|uniref:DUF3137 domain-containing protein n=1 Tax=Henriciella litoralis TaxID=568102 RepID=UPI0009FCD77D|nr:DUF3137 domain-containing protein [Henriciella litoralis]
MTIQTMLDAQFERMRSQRPEYDTAIIIWRDKLEPVLADLEVRRKATVSKAYKHTIITSLVMLAIVVGVGYFAGFGYIFPFGIFAGIVLTVLISAVVWIQVFAVKSQTKQIVVGAACQPFGFQYETLHPDMEGVKDYRSFGSWLKSNAKPLNHADEPPTPAFDGLKNAGLMPSYDKRKFEDLITGKRAEANFSLVECKLTQEQGSGKNRRTVTKFQGLLLDVEYPERFLGRTILARDGWWKRGKGAGDLQKVQLVSVELDRAFTVYSNDQVEARALLTPDRMERLIALERHFKGGKIRGVFEEGHLTIALEAKDQFEAGSVFKPLVDPRRFIETLTEIGLVCDLIDGFLTREWYKDKI